jgi:hypothetical protein
MNPMLERIPSGNRRRSFITNEFAGLPAVGKTEVHLDHRQASSQSHQQRGSQTGGTAMFTPVEADQSSSHNGAMHKASRL